MRDCTRNKRIVYYAKLMENYPLTDDNGYETGEFGKEYTTIKSLFISESGAMGKMDALVFGNDVNYDKVLIGTDTTLRFSEEDNSIWVFWVGEKHEKDKFDHNYILKRVSKTKNGIALALSSVSAS